MCAFFIMPTIIKENYPSKTVKWLHICTWYKIKSRTSKIQRNKNKEWEKIKEIREEKTVGERREKDMEVEQKAEKAE